MKAPRAVDGTKTTNESKGTNWSFMPPFQCGPVTQVHIKSAVTAQVISLSGPVFVYEMTVGLYIRLHPQYGMVLDSDII